MTGDNQEVSSELFSGAFDSADVANAAKTDLDFLSALAMPSVFEFGWPRILLGVWAWLCQEIQPARYFPNMALGLPRGFGKTTLVKLFVLWCILFTNRKFILVMSATAHHAQNIIRDVASMLDEPNIKKVFGDWRLGIETDNKDVKIFGFRGRTIILAGLGAGGSVRGLNVDNARPDVMIFEDVQTREDADSQKVSEDLEKWMLGTAMKAKSPKGCMTLFIANMYPTPHSLLKKLKKNKHWAKFICGGILEDGTSLWEDLQPIKQLLTEYLRDADSGHPEIFHAEVLNDENASLNNLVDFSKLKPYPFEDDDIAGGKFIVIDPATDKANADAVSVGYFEVHGNSEPVLIEVTEGRLSPKETIMEAIRMCAAHNCYLVVIESNSYQYTLKWWSEELCRQLGIVGITFIDIYSGRMSKNSRILNMFKSYQKGEQWVHPRCRSLVHSQISGFNPLKTDNIDGLLDLLTYAPRVVAEFANLLTILTIEGAQEFQAAEAEEYSEAQGSPF
ncbi:hypothetical protein D3C80_129070 [compost metagenome]